MFVEIVVLLCCLLCAAEELAQNDTQNDVKDIAITTLKPSSSSSTAKPSAQLKPGIKEDSDYSFQNDRLPLLSEDEFNNLTDDANPLHFLKQLPEVTKPQDTKPEPAAASPIYITIPIYINTSGKIPLSLTIGDQELTLAHQQRLNSGQKRHESTKVPNSHFNRLLDMIEPPKRRTTNRHRSPSRSKIQALKEHNTAQIYKELQRKKVQQ